MITYDVYYVWCSSAPHTWICSDPVTTRLSNELLTTSPHILASHTPGMQLDNLQIGGNCNWSLSNGQAPSCLLFIHNFVYFRFSKELLVIILCLWFFSFCVGVNILGLITCVVLDITTFNLISLIMKRTWKRGLQWRLLFRMIGQCTDFIRYLLNPADKFYKYQLFY